MLSGLTHRVVTLPVSSYCTGKNCNARMGLFVTCPVLNDGDIEIDRYTLLEAVNISSYTVTGHHRDE